MKYLIQFQVNLFSLLILFGLYLFLRSTKIKSYSKRLIYLLIIASAISIVMEPLTWIFDSEHFFLAFFLEYITNFILFLVSPIIAGLLISYVDFRIYKNPKQIRKRLYYQQGSIFTLVVLIINIFKPIYFSVNPVTHGFSGGNFQYVHIILIVLIYINMLVMVLRHIKQLLVKESVIFILCFFLPIIGMTIQLYESMVYLSWTSIVFVLFIVYLFLETEPTEEDYLTKMYNRKSYETHITYLVQNKQDFNIISFDLNEFKQINDRFGHSKGDYVLIEFGKILKSTFSEIGLVARLGGDEFAVVIGNKEANIDILINNIYQEISKHRDLVVQTLKFSYGYQIYSEKMSIDELYINVDKKMYDMKKNMKTNETD